MIVNKTHLNMNEVEEIVKELQDNEKKQEIELFLKKFLKRKSKESERLKENLEKLDFLKIKKEHIVKIVDMLPEDSSDINKIFIDVSLNEDETEKILGVIKNSEQ